MERVTVLAALSLSAVVIDDLPAQARTPWGSVGAAREFSFELQRPDFSGGGLSLTSFVLYTRVRTPMSPSVAAVAELPLARFAPEGGGSATHSVGNPYVGLDFEGPGGLEGAFGVRLALGEASAFAGLADYNRVEAWIEDTWALTARIGNRSAAPSGFEPRVAAGLTVFRSNVPGADTEVFVDYRVSAGYRDTRVATAVELTGRYLVTATGSLAELTFHQVALGVGGELGRVWPTVAFRAPLDEDLLSELDWVAELGIAVRF